MPTTATERLAAAAGAVLAGARQSRPELVAELSLLAVNDPDGVHGMHVHYDRDHDRYVLSWVGTVLGEVAGRWVRGEVG